jgi:hypothetical protein
MKRTLLFWSLSALFAVGTITSGCEKPTPERYSGRESESVDLVVLSDFGTGINSETVDNTGGEVTIFVGSNHFWKASVDESIEWLALNDWEDERENDKYEESRVTVIVAPNNDEAERSATITFTSDNKTTTLTVTQGATFLNVESPLVDILFSGETKSVAVSTNALEWGAEVISGGDWCSVVKNGSASISITAEANNTDNERTAVLNITAGNIIREVTVVQGDSQNVWEDKEVVQVQKATKGKGVELIFMGEGYIAADMAKGAGKYHRDMYAAIEHFFSVYPYNAYREYFNVWIVGAISKESGMSVAGGARKNTVFKLLWEGNGGTGIGCDGNGNGWWEDDEDGVILEYTRLVCDRPDVRKNINEMTVIIPINMDIYAGTCAMFMDGFSYSMCPANTETRAGMTFQALTVHEAGGHGFAKLTDEYINKNGTIPGNEKQDLLDWQNNGFCANVDVLSGGNVTKTHWASIAANTKYSVVGARYSRVDIWEGGNYYKRGVWRPERNSCMNDNVLYFNAPSRWAAVRRIMKLSGEDTDYTIAEFMEDDVIPQYPESSGMGTRSPEPFIPLGRPRLVK